METWTGFLRLAVKHKQERTIPDAVYYQGALRVSQPIYLDNSRQPCYYLVNLGGGYVDGDRYRTEINLSEQAHLLLTTQSSTKIYKTFKRPVVHETEISLAPGSYLEYLPDPIIAYEFARFKQDTVIHLQRGATLVYAEIVTPGWSPDGRLFSYDWVQLRTRIYQDDELVLFDHVRLCPAEQAVDEIGMLEGYTHVGSMVLIGDGATSEFLELLFEEINSKMPSVKIGLSKLMIPGIALRVLADSTSEIEAVFETCQRFVRQQWFDYSPVSLRKY